MKRYYHLLHYAYKIIIAKQSELFNANRLQMIIKVINDIIELNELILTLLIFGVYFKITELNLFNFIVE